MWPEQTTFIDARTDFFGEKLLREYLIVNNVNAGWEEILDKYSVSWIFIPRQGVLYKYLGSTQNTTWHLIYEDDFAVIYRR